MTDGAAKLRAFYAKLVTARGGTRDPQIKAAFAAVPRETFVGSAPWFVAVVAPSRPAPAHIETLDDDPLPSYTPMSSSPWIPPAV